MTEKRKSPVSKIEFALFLSVCVNIGFMTLTVFNWTRYYVDASFHVGEEYDFVSGYEEEDARPGGGTLKGMLSSKGDDCLHQPLFKYWTGEGKYLSKAKGGSRYLPKAKGGSSGFEDIWVVDKRLRPQGHVPLQWGSQPPTECASQAGFDGDLEVWMNGLRHTEWRVFSQFGEDGVIHAIFSRIGVTDKFFVEFGVQDGRQCGTRFLRKFQGWTGKLMDGDNNVPHRNLTSHKIYSHNIVGLFEQFQIPKEFDHLTIDLDLTTYYIVSAVFSAGYRPRHAIVECNPAIPLDRWITYPEGTGKFRETWPYYGASVPAVVWMMHTFGYWCVHLSNDGDNLFFIRNDVLISTFPEAKAVIHAVTTRADMQQHVFRQFKHVLEQNSKWNVHTYWPQIRNKTWIEV